MKKYFFVSVSLAIIAALIKGCSEYQKKQFESSQVAVPVYMQSDASYVMPNSSTADEINYTEVYNLVNSEVYGYLLQARNNFSKLYAGGEVSSQMENNGTVLSPIEAEVIDVNMLEIYRLIYDYINYYNQGDVQSCYQTAQLLFRNNMLSKEYLYSILVSRKLPGECQGSINFQEGLIYDGRGNIILNNGRLLRLIGGEDDIISADVYTNDPYNNVVKLSEWYAKLPSIILDQYTYLTNSRGYDGVCYVWNQSNVEKACYHEWDYIRENAREVYGLDPDDTFMHWDSNRFTYVYEDQYGQIFPFDLDTSNRLAHIFEVQDALVSRVGDVYSLDGYVKNMRASSTYQEYVK